MGVVELEQRIEGQVVVLQRRGPYVLLVIAFLLSLTLIQVLESHETVPVLVIGTLALAGWHWYCVDRRWGQPMNDRLGRVYLGVRTVAVFVLTWVNPFYSVFGWIGYIDAPSFVSRRPALVVTVVTAVTVAGAQSGGLPPQSALQGVGFAALVLFNLALVIFFARLETHQEKLAQERRDAMTVLEQTNVRLAETLAENAALQEQLLAQARESGVHDERQRLALEIHDTIAQNLAGIVTQLSAAAEVPSTARAREHQGRAMALARDALGQARRSVQGLAPDRLDDCDLTAALEQVVADWSTGVGIEGNLVVDGTAEPLHRDVETTVLRIAQEALTNVGKHAQARRVGVTLSYMGDVVTLDVRDDGVGFAPDRLNGGGVGLHGMQQRAARVAGRVVVESEPGGGTAVSLLVPAVGGD